MSTIVFQSPGCTARRTLSDPPARQAGGGRWGLAHEPSETHKRPAETEAGAAACLGRRSCDDLRRRVVTQSWRLCVSGV